MGAIVADQARRWFNGIVPYAIDDTSFPMYSKERAYITDAIIKVQNQTNVRFVVRTSQADYVYFTKAASSCSSAVGRVGGRQAIGCDLYSGLFGTGSIVHEIMHALGFIHEHQRTDRNEWVFVDMVNVLRPTDFAFFPEQTINLSPYDYGSVMHYPSRISSKAVVRDTTKPTIRPIQTVPIDVIVGQRGALTNFDMMAVNSAYPGVTASGKAVAPPITEKPAAGPYKLLHFVQIAVVLILVVLAVGKVREW